MSYAPILISVYDRLNHFKNCINSLRKNSISRYSDLYIVTDAAKTKDDELKVKLVREYIDQIEGFNKVISIQNEVNLGPRLSIRKARDTIFGLHDRLIFLEDDNIVSLNFLRFINEGLEFYKDDASIIFICGYNYPIEIPTAYKYDIYKYQGFIAWGYGMWYNKFKEIELTLPELSEFKKNKQLRKEMDRIGEHRYWYILNCIITGEMAGDVIYGYNMTVKNLFSIIPVVSKVRNMGHDGSGVHCGVSDLFANQTIDTELDFDFVKDICPNEEINEILRKYFKLSLRNKIIRTTQSMLSKRQIIWLRRYKAIIGKYYRSR